jgi:peptidoglycan hydrolase CwlO-like protein
LKKVDKVNKKVDEVDKKVAEIKTEVKSMDKRLTTQVADVKLQIMSLEM